MKIDGKEITGMYLGAQEISNAYVGEKEVFSKAPAGPLYAAYNLNAWWLYAKYPIDGSLIGYRKNSNLEKASSSSELTASFTAESITEEQLVSGWFTLIRDRTADLYT